MGLFDYYEPEPPLRCPSCGATLAAWQGKGGPCVLAPLRQGVRQPDDRLDGRFVIYTRCCSEEFVYAIGTASAGLWTDTRLMRADDVDENSQAR